MRDRFSSNALSRMGRRGFLKTLGALGVSASTASALTQSAVADAVDDPRREVPRIRAFKHTNHEEVVEEGAKPEREPEVYTIPRWRWARIEAAHDARRKVAKRLPGKHPVWVTTDSNGEKKIVVEQSDNGDLRSADVRALDEQVPASVNGVAGRRSRFEDTHKIPVDIERPRADSPNNSNSPFVENVGGDYSTLSHDGSDNYHYQYEWNEVPAGACTIFANDTGGSVDFSYATTGFPVWDNGTKKMISAGHNWTWPSRQDSAEGAWADQSVSVNVSYSGNESITESPDFSEDRAVVDTNHNGGIDPLDCSLMTLDSGADDVHYNFAADSNGGTESWPIYGGLAQDRIKDLEDNGTNENETLYKQGARTSRDRCSITGVADRSFRLNLIKGDDVQGGDSGGPVTLIKTDPDLPYSAAYPGGVVSGGIDGQEIYITSTPAIENKFSLTV